MSSRGGRGKGAQFVDPTALPSKRQNMRQEEPSREEESCEEYEEVNVVELMNAMTVDERRKVYALKGHFNEFMALRKKFHEELNLLRVEQLASINAMAAVRHAIISGEREVTKEEEAHLMSLRQSVSAVEEIDVEEAAPKKKGVKIVSPDEEATEKAISAAGASNGGGVPNFWSTLIQHHENLSGLVTERDRAPLSHLCNVTKEFIDGDSRNGFRLLFHFSKNEFFTNEVLTKTYEMEFDEDDGELTYKDIKGCTIDWVSPEVNPTVIIKQKKQRHKSGKGVRVVKREEKCDSFFNFFTAPGEGEDKGDDDDDDDDEFLQQELEMDTEIGEEFADVIISSAGQIFSGRKIDEMAKALQQQFGNLEFGVGDDEDEEDDDDDEDEESEDEAPPAKRGGRGCRGGRGNSAGAAPECKQQ